MPTHFRCMNGWKYDLRYCLKWPNFIPASRVLSRSQCHNNKSKTKISHLSSVTNRVSSVWMTPTSHAVPVYVTLRPYAQVDLVTYGSSGSIGHSYRFRLLPVQESFLWTKGASMIISSMSALQLHLLLIHNLLIPQVRLQHAHKCMLHLCMYVCVCSFNGIIDRLVNTYFNGRKDVILLHAAI